MGTTSEDILMDATFKIRRFDPEDKQDPHYEDFNVELPEYGSVLEGLLDIREQQDGTLSLRCSCKSAICGSCSMKINGESRLACKAMVSEIKELEGDLITIEPMGNMPVIKDLVVDMDSFWHKVESVEPYLQPKGPEPEKEYLVSNDQMMTLAVAMNCIMCGACVSDCTVLEVDSNFLGPAALAKAFRFAADPRDGAQEKRLEMYDQPDGVWDCTRCFMCVQACPKDVAPMERIMDIRSMAVEKGISKGRGMKHIQGFINGVKHSGRLDEFGLARKTYGFPLWPFMLAPMGIRRLLRKRLPPIFHKSIAGAKNVKKIFENLGV
jgi:succinate dehydrogenase / fumarate reductase iron-sulfur subunit